MNRYYQGVTRGRVTIPAKTPRTMLPLLRPYWSTAGVSERKTQETAQPTQASRPRVTLRDLGAKNTRTCETKVLHPARRDLRRTNRHTKHATERHGSRLPKLQGRIEVLVPDKRRPATRQQWANTKKPTTKEMQVMPENIRHYRKLATEMLWKLDLGNPPNITRKIKTVTTVGWLGSFFRGRNWHRDYPIVHSTEKHRNIRQNIF